MSESQMSDATFGRLFIIMIVTMCVLAVFCMIIASATSSKVNQSLEEQSYAENSSSIAAQIAPVGQIYAGEGDAAVEAEAEPELELISGDAAYNGYCGACHGNSALGAPVIGVAADWEARIAQGVETLYDHAINGYQGANGLMPAKGGAMQLADESVTAAVDYMIADLK